ncbi:DUF4404 family protein [Kangiella taiwanensis]|uniref:DUF4404 domain-containing protein n=1 Tax=Kangiella taiwanensis TaxID=1079179 RepID=A0ABP8I8S0_9GAMM|nr:DUF4404 family protein [Kangiella taiwanensis]
MSHSDIENSKLKALAEQLITELDGRETLSKEDTLALAKLELIIESKLFQQDAEENPEEYLIERFQERLYNFEREYPSLSSFIRRISNSLSNIGI